MIANIVVGAKPKHPVIYQDKYWTVYIEKHLFGNVFHCDVHSWGPQAYKSIMKSWMCIICENLEPVYAYTDNDKLRKFCRMLGLQYKEKVMLPNGETIGELYELKEQTCPQ